MRWLVTGADGQVGRAFARRAAEAGHEVVALGRASLDVTDADAVIEATRGADAVLNAAAYTAVDRAEAEPDVALAVNAEGAGNVARACRLAGARLVHLSTDYVFDGAKGPWREADPVAPIGAYGRSKAAGEARVREELGDALIVRTAWVFSSHGTNFVKTIVRLAQEREVLRVVADQRGCPTWADDVAAAALAFVARDARGTLHFAGSPPTTWHGFAEAIVSGARRRRPLRVRRVDAITTAEYPTPARRPADSVLDGSAAAALGVPSPPWQRGLDAVLAELLP